jgi:hypothetical protein
VIGVFILLPAWSLAGGDEPRQISQNEELQVKNGLERAVRMTNTR